MKLTTINIKGMHCNSCKLLLEKSISKIDKIETVQANISKWTVTIWYEKIPNMDDIRNVVHECGYEVSEEVTSNPWLSKNIDDYKVMILSLLWFMFLYFILSKTGVSSLFDIKSQWSPSLSLVLLIWITAGFSSCMAVVGWLVLAISSKWNKSNNKQTFGQKIIPHFWFNAWRIIWFGILWGLLWLFGSVISLSPFMMSIMTLIVWVVMIMLWVNLTHISPKLSSVSLSLPTWRLFAKKETDLLQDKNTWFRKYLWTFSSWVLTFFLPCGFTFAMQIYAMNTGSFWMWMIVMALFAIGTLPGLMGIWSLTSIFKGKTAQIAFKAIWVLVILLGLYNIANSYSVVATRFHSWETNTSVNSNQSTQIINMTYTDSGLTPSVVNLQIDKTYTIVIDIETNIYGCMSTIYIPGLDENIQSIKKWNQITFVVHAATAWEYEFDCAMWLSHNAKIVVK